MTLTHCKHELARLELCQTHPTGQYVAAQIALERARVARLRETLTLEDETVYLVTTDPDDDESDEIRLGSVWNLSTWQRAVRLCPGLLENLDQMRRDWDADEEQAESDRAGWEAEYASTRGV